MYTPTTEIYTYSHTRSLQDALPIFPLLGLDIFRTQKVSQSLVIRPRLARIGAGTRSTDLDALLDQDALYLSRAAMTQTGLDVGHRVRSEEHTSELQSLMRISYAVFCLKKQLRHISHTHITYQ